MTVVYRNLQDKTNEKPPDFAYFCKISQLIISETAKPEIFTANLKPTPNNGSKWGNSGSETVVTVGERDCFRIKEKNPHRNALVSGKLIYLRRNFI